MVGRPPGYARNAVNVFSARVYAPVRTMNSSAAKQNCATLAWPFASPFATTTCEGGGLRDSQVAAPLKPSVFAWAVRLFMSPRLPSRGPIEALFRVAFRLFARCLRDSQVAAPLKRDYRCGSDCRASSPRLPSRGPIEAKAWPSATTTATWSPRLPSRGPIEASRPLRMYRNSDVSATPKSRPH